MKKAIDKATTLLEALPYIRRFADKTFVIKLGGSTMVDPKLMQSFALDVILLSCVGIRPVLVHGGGPQIGELLKRLGKESTFIDGLRVTDSETMDIVEMVLMGKINKDIVGHINKNGGKAVGLSGKDGELILAEKLRVRKKRGSDAPADLGMVGSVVSVNPRVINTLDMQQFIPVIAPLGTDAEGRSYNINADTAAGEIASALKAEKLMLLTDVEGVKDRKGSLCSTVCAREIGRMVKGGDISGGMIPKVHCCAAAIKNGVGKAHIIDGRIEHAVLLEIFTDVGIGTQIIV